MRDIKIPCLLLSIGLGVGKPFYKRIRTFVTKEKSNLVEDFHEGEFFDTGQSGKVEPIILFSALEIISGVFNGFEGNSSQSKITIRICLWRQFITWRI